MGVVREQEPIVRVSDLILLSLIKKNYLNSSLMSERQFERLMVLVDMLSWMLGWGGGEGG